MCESEADVFVISILIRDSYDNNERGAIPGK